MKKIILLFVCIVFLPGCGGADSHKYSRVETVMDTFIQIKVFDRDLSSEDLAGVVDSVIGDARALEDKLSIFNASSEINMLNLEQEKQVSQDLWNILVLAKKIGVMTGGEFDITIAPIMKANGFYGDMPKEILDKIPEDLKGVGWDNVELISAYNRVKLFNGAWLDLSAIAKGYIVDKISEELRKQGIDHFLVNAGGDIYCGTTGEAYPWKIGVRRPGEGGVVMVLELDNLAVATSGDYENVITDKETGEVISHIIDPATDEPVEEKPSSMTVIASTCAESDALATGMMAMGREKAMALADSTEGIDIISIETHNGEEYVKSSKDASQYIVRRLM